MAIVRITENVINEIDEQIISQFNVRTKALASSYRASAYEVEQFVNETITCWLETHGSTRAAFNALPKDCFPTLSRNRITHINGQNITGIMDSDTTSPMHVPNEFTAWQGAKLTLNIENNECIQNVIDRAAELQAKHEEILQERHRVRESVRKILSSFPSVNKALDFWPPLRELLTERIKDRIDQEVERKKKNGIDTDALAEISLDNLNVSLVKNKLASA